ncbi:cysteine hydrolase family protein [Methylobacterium iners]|jgi:nicotinamidase-related amidase|uniref:Peroxyureidoacrylate/ureidoacrylate amidohydrolase RutB n=1 Tax=Methylobacterium iners TaxID=418707 RepID=A0ABQ4RX89_9HYPH|nr:cysteine hydrolase [Methylobacterium iners]GJD95450.1 Peroxyureidoacrylate/ureidoacrylate amidohydrolase RutB [Methylobacterium iners]
MAETRNEELRYGPLGRSCAHLCVDMQRMFAEKTDWHTPWMPRAMPNVRRIVEAWPARTWFTRFIPARYPGEGRGTWSQYSKRWSGMTLEALDPDLVELMPELAEFVPPAEIVDKRVYSPWLETGLDARLQARGIDTLVVSGCETDVCVLAAVLGAVDRGYRIVVAIDALCSSSDEAHDALLTLYRSRYGQQVETVQTETVIREWTE